MGEVPAADRGGRVHGHGLREPDAGAALGIENAEQRDLLRVVRASRIARRRPDAAVLLADQLLVGQPLLAAVAPVGPGDRVQPLGECLGQPVGQGLGP